MACLVVALALARPAHRRPEEVDPRPVVGLELGDVEAGGAVGGDHVVEERHGSVHRLEVVAVGDDHGSADIMVDQAEVRVEDPEPGHSLVPCSASARRAKSPMKGSTSAVVRWSGDIGVTWRMAPTLR